MAYEEEKLEQIIGSLDPAFTNVVEFRNETWWTTHVYNKLARSNITFCGISHPSLPNEVVKNTKTVYYRFHGVPRLYQSKYEITMLQRISNEIESDRGIEEAFVYFNNDIDASAIANALEMNEYIERYK